MRTLREWIARFWGTLHPRRRDGNLEQELRLPWLDDLARDVRHALRTLRRGPAFTAVVLLTLALGIGANSAIFSLTDALLLKTLAVNRPDRLYFLKRDERALRSFSFPALRIVRDRLGRPDILFAVDRDPGQCGGRRGSDSGRARLARRSDDRLEMRITR